VEESCSKEDYPQESRTFRSHLPLVLSCVFLGGCASPKADDLSANPYHQFCYGSILGPDIASFLATHGIDCLDGGSDLGTTDWVVRGTAEERFRARALVLAQVRNAGWKVSWPADSIVLMDEWEEIGFDKGPWVHLASVRHRETATEAVLGRFRPAGIPALFLFGETSDLVFVRAVDAAAAMTLLRESKDAAVTIHQPKICAHLPPPVIRRATRTTLILMLTASDSERPLRERVEDLICAYSFPGMKSIEGHTMVSKVFADGTLMATYELPIIPAQATGFLEYSFEFTLDGRSYRHGSPGEPFRVPLE
jgi:hypothetical protein